MRYWLIAALPALLALSTTGCDKDPVAGGGSTRAPDPGGRTAIVDLDQVATDLGWMREMQSNMTTLDQQLKNDLNRIREAYDTQLRDKYREFAPQEGDKLTQAQQETLQQMLSVGRQNMAQVENAANQQFQTYRSEWVKQYRQAIAPVVREVATQKKMSVVLNKSDPILYSDQLVDLTDAVVDAARAKPPVLHPVPVPTINAPGLLQVPSAASTQNSSATPPRPATAPTTKP
jgi:Skp family chaperone for outer membrane proteins